MFQPRNNNGACLTRLSAGLKAHGMHVIHEKGPWCHSKMAKDHLYSVLDDQGGSQWAREGTMLHRTMNEHDDVEVLTCAWLPFPSFSIS